MRRRRFGRPESSGRSVLGRVAGRGAEEGLGVLRSRTFGGEVRRVRGAQWRGCEASGLGQFGGLAQKGRGGEQRRASEAPQRGRTEWRRG